jgi:FKBP-type peptidyl-prolyl cis-trans isomerase SlyD
MHIGEKKVVTIEYTLKDDKGEVLDTSDGREPLTYIQGIGNLVPGLESALEGKSEGEALDVTLKPEDGYGVRDEKLVRKLPMRKLADKNPKVGGRYRAQLDDGMRVVLVTGISGDYAAIDGNHPLADKTLHFAIKVKKIRDATDDELTHGHVHGDDGHHHH